MRGAGTLLAVLALVAAACGSGTASERDAYVRANEELVESLPRFPGAREVERVSSPYFEGDSASAPAAGYTTRVVYELPRRVPQRRVVDFYVGTLRGWRSHVEYTPGVDIATGEERPGDWGASFTRGDARFGVGTDNLIQGRRFEVSVDHRGA